MVDKNDLVGKQLGDYLIKEKLATGGMSYVFMGEDVSLGRRAAVKVLTPDITEDDDSLPDRFKREARAVAQLEHDFIIPIYQFGELEGVYFLAMRYIDGHDFADEITEYKREGKLFPIERALDILEQVGSALDYAHSNGIIHRDIKPSNVLIDQNGKAILTDFGLVLWSNVDKTLGTAFGTPRYISPEQATDSQAAVAQSDIYSLAVIMYEIVTGKMLFTGQTPMEMAISHITEKPVPPRQHNPEIPLDVEQVILKSLDKEPTKRHQTAMEFVQELRHAYRKSGGITTISAQQSNRKSSGKGDVKRDTKPVNTKILSPIDPADNATTVTPIKSQTKSELIRGAKPLTMTQGTLQRARPPRRTRPGILLILLFAIIAVIGAYAIASENINSAMLPTQAALVDTTQTLALADITEEVTATDTETIEPTETATDEATEIPTDEPTETDLPEDTPTDEPTVAALIGEPSLEPSETDLPEDTPTDKPTVKPSATSTPTKTSTPTTAPSVTIKPSVMPSRTATSIPSITPTRTPFPTLQSLPNGVDVSLIYNPQIFAIRNDSGGSIVVSDMLLSGVGDNDTGNFIGENYPVGALLPGECIVVRAENINTPADWGCVNETSNTLFGADRRFWFADGRTDTEFTVYWRGNIINTCNTVGRAVAIVTDVTCELKWPSVAEG